MNKTRFRGGIGTREMLFCMNVIAAKMQEISKAGFRAS